MPRTGSGKLLERTVGVRKCTNCYAGLFARLPSLSQIYEAPHHSAQALYNFIFAPEQPLDVPQHPEPTPPTTTPDLAAPDASMGPVDSAHEPLAPSSEPTPFGVPGDIRKVGVGRRAWWHDKGAISRSLVVLVMGLGVDGRLAAPLIVGSTGRVEV